MWKIGSTYQNIDHWELAEVHKIWLRSMKILSQLWFHRTYQVLLLIKKFIWWVWPKLFGYFLQKCNKCSFWKCAFFLFLPTNHACILCSFRWIDRWLKTKYETPNVSWSFLLWSQFEKIRRNFSWHLVFRIWFLVTGRSNEKNKKCKHDLVEEKERRHIFKWSFRVMTNSSSSHYYLLR